MFSIKKENNKLLIKEKRSKIVELNKQITLYKNNIKKIKNRKKLNDEQKSELVLIEEKKIEELNNNINILSNINQVSDKSDKDDYNLMETDLLNESYELLDNNLNKINYTILKDDNIIITNIIHLADIHIRLNIYHDEYKQVFNRLYDSLNRLKEINKNIIIAICGDLLHTKNLLTPDCTIITWDFLHNLSKIYPVIIIMGNHDKMLDMKKTDSISSILKDRPIENIYYIKNSGVYKYNNIIFGISSYKDQILVSKIKVDKVLEENKVDQKSNKIICLYHGIVGDIINNNLDYTEDINECDNYIVKSKRLTLKSFGSYDFFLFGDVHKFHYLNNEKTAAYCGSLISQDFGESDDYHGYINWDIINKQSEYIKIYNENAYNVINIKELMIDIETNDIKLYDNLIKDKLGIKAGYLRIDYNSLLRYKLNYKEISKQILNINNRLKIIYKPLLISEDISDNIDNNFLNKQNINNDNIKNEEMNLVRKYILDHYTIKEENIDLIMKELNKLLEEEKINKKEIEYELGEWKILYLEFDNMFGYGEGNTIDFTKYSVENNDIIGIFGNNSIGKSSIIDIITLMLFDKIARNNFKLSSVDIINKNKKKAIGNLVIEVNSELYLIKRKIYQVRTRSSGELRILQLYKLILCKDKSLLNKILIENKIYYRFKNNIYIKEVIEDTKRTCQDEIIRLIGSYEHFVYTSLILQNNNQSFLYMSSKDKKNLLSICLKLDKYNYIKKRVLELNSIYKEKYRELTKRKDKLLLLGDLDESKKLINLELDDIEEKLKNLKKIKEEKELLLYNDKLYIIDTDYIDIIKYRKDIEKLKSDNSLNELNLEELYEKKNNNENLLRLNLIEINNIKLNIEINNNELLLLRDKKKLIISEYEYHIKELNISDIENIDIKTLDLLLYNNNIRLNQLLSFQDFSIENINFDEYLIKLEENYKIYINNLISLLSSSDYILKDNKILEDIINLKKEIDNILEIYKRKDIIIKIKDENRMINLFILEYNNIKEINKKIENIENSNKCIYNKLIEYENSKINNDIKEIEEKINNILIINNKISNLLYIKEQKIKEFEENQEKIIENKKIKEKRDILIDNIRELEIDIENNQNKKIELLNKLKILELDIISINNIEKELNDVYIYKDIYEIINNLVSNNGLEIYLISKYLDNINSSINNIIQQYSNKKLELYIKKDELHLNIYIDNNMIIKMLGAMECFIVDLVFKIIIGTITEIPKCQMLFIDEGISVLDKDNLSNIENLFLFIKQYYTSTFIITHIEQIKDNINHIIYINKINNYSYVSSYNYIRSNILEDIE